MEKFKEGHTGKNFVVDQPVLKFNKPVFRKKVDLPKATENDSAKNYLLKRKLNPDKFYYAEKFKSWVNTQKKTFDYTRKDEPRIIILMYDEEKQLIGFQGRALDSSPNKYITIMLQEDAPKIYGLDSINREKPIYIVEGPFDSTFVENGVAMCGADVDVGSFGWSNYIWVLDNEPRNGEITNRISKLIDRGEKVVIWPSNVTEKDINDMVLSGHDVMSVLKSSTYSGLEAKIKFNNWKKV